MGHPRDLLATTDWVGGTKSDRDLSFVKTPKKAADLLTAAESKEKVSLDVVIKPGESNAKTRAKQKTRAFVDLVKEGFAPEDAAEKIGLNLGEISKISSQADMKSAVADVLQTGFIRSDVRKEVLRSGINKMIMEALLEGDRKSFYDGYKLAASDPEIGLTGPSVAIQNNIDISDLGDILKEFMTPANEGSAGTPQNMSDSSQILIDTVTEET
jgi:hypothetical protein